MTTHEELQAFANSQVDMNNEMLESIRIHHGPRLAAIAVGLINNVSIAQNLSLGFAGLAAQTLEGEMFKTCSKGIDALMRRCEENTAALFTTVLTEEEALILEPFMQHAIDNCNAIIRKTLEAIEG